MDQMDDMISFRNQLGIFVVVRRSLLVEFHIQGFYIFRIIW